MTTLMNDACKRSYQMQLGTYVENSYRTVTIDTIDVAFSKWQDNDEDRILVKLCILDGNNKSYITTEYKIRDNRIYSYEMW